MFLKIRSQGAAEASIFFAATNGWHWIQCECSHCVAWAVTAAVVPHKMGSEPISCGCGSSIMREVQIVYIQSLKFSKFWTF